MPLVKIDHFYNAFDPSTPPEKYSGSAPVCMKRTYHIVPTTDVPSKVLPNLCTYVSLQNYNGTLISMTCSYKSDAVRKRETHKQSINFSFLNKIMILVGQVTKFPPRASPILPPLDPGLMW